MSERAFVFVHGIGGPCPLSLWIDPLNASLAKLRLPSIDARADQLINIDYLRVLQRERIDHGPERTGQPSEAELQLESWHRYLIRKESFERLIDQSRKGSAQLPFGQVPTSITDPIPHALPIVRTYLIDERARNAAWCSVLGQLPSRGSLIIVAHSLGSILVLDLLARLPKDLHVDLLVTIGSPLAIGAFRRHLGGLGSAEEFPADRVDAWVNVYDPDDVVTAGRGAAQQFEAAIDVPIDTGASHVISAYMAHPVVATAIGIAAFGPMNEPAQGTPSHRLHPHWRPVLLRFAYLRQLWSIWPAGKWQERRRMDTACRVLATRVIAQAEQQRERIEMQINALPAFARDELEGELADRFFARGRMPSVDSLVRDAGALARGQFTDDELVIAGVDVLLGMPFAPFGIEVDDRQAQRALAELLDEIRPDPTGSGAPISAQVLAEEIATSVADAKKALATRGVPWAPLLLGAGALVLAGTGIGLAAAVPAGLAGAAAVAATLATFGPGGMAGGVATLAVLTGTSAALASAGLAMTGSERVEFDRLQADLVEEVSQLPVPAFRTAVAGLLAVQATRQRLGLASAAEALERSLLAVEGAVLAERWMHQAIAPKAEVTKQWRAKSEIIDKARVWLASTLRPDQAQMREEVGRAIETGRTQHLRGPALPSAEQAGGPQAGAQPRDSS